MRQRDSVLEYADILKSKTDADALKYLTTMVNTVQEPWRILVEVARLRDFHRTQLDGWTKERAASSRQEREGRSQREVTERKLGELQRELDRGTLTQRGLREKDDNDREMVPQMKRLKSTKSTSSLTSVDEPATSF